MYTKYQLGHFGEDPCAIPASEECEKHHCPSGLSSQPPPFCLWACSADCRRYVRDKRAGAVTTKEELSRAGEVRTRINKLERQQVSAQALEAKALTAAARSRKETEKQKAALSRNIKILTIGGAVIGILLVGRFFIKKGEK